MLHAPATQRRYRMRHVAAVPVVEEVALLADVSRQVRAGACLLKRGLLGTGGGTSVWVRRWLSLLAIPVQEASGHDQHTFSH